MKPVPRAFCEVECVQPPSSENSEPVKSRFCFAFGEQQATATVERAVADLEVGGSTKLAEDSELPGYELTLVKCVPPENPEPSADEHRVRGNQMVARNNWQDALAEYRKGIRALPSGSPTDGDPTLEEKLRVNAALCLINLKRYREAIAFCDLVVHGNPNSTKAYFRRGKSWRELGELELAVGDFERASETAEDPQTVQRDLEAAKRLRDEKKKKDRELFKKTYQLDVKW